MLHKQRGASYLGIFFAIVLAAFAAKMSIATWPAYWDDRIINGEINAALASMPNNDATISRLKQDLSRRFEMNGIRGVKVDDMMVITNTAGLAVQKDYEVRKPFMANIELVMTFKKDFDQKTAVAK